MIGLNRQGGLEGAIAALGQMPRARPSMRAPAPAPAQGLAAPTATGMRDAFSQGEQARAGLGRVGDWIGRQVNGAPGERPAVGPAAPLSPEFGGGDPGAVPPLPPDVPIALQVEPMPPMAAGPGGMPLMMGPAGGMGFAAGGLADVGPRAPKRPAFRARRVGAAGLVHSATPGRADLVSSRLRRGAYVLPADVVSSLGQGNTLAGAKLLASSLPEAAEMASRGAVDRADGGMIEDPDEIEVRLSGGEYLVAPEQVLAIGGGSVEEGAKALDALVHAVRGEAVETMSRMPPPK